MKNSLTKLYNLKRGLAFIIGTLATMVASNATSMCIFGTFYEAEMPKCLYINEKLNDK